MKEKAFIDKNFLKRFYLQKLKTNEPNKINNFKNNNINDDEIPLNIITQLDKLENGEVYEIKFKYQFDQLISVARVILPITFADRVKHLVIGSNLTKYSFYDENEKNHKKFLIQIENKKVKFNDEQCIVSYFKDVTNRVYEG